MEEAGIKILMENLEHDVQVPQTRGEIRRDSRFGDPNFIDDPVTQAWYFWKDVDCRCVFDLYTLTKHGKIYSLNELDEKLIRKSAIWWNAMSADLRRCAIQKISNR